MTTDIDLRTMRSLRDEIAQLRLREEGYRTRQDELTADLKEVNERIPVLDTIVRNLKSDLDAARSECGIACAKIRDMKSGSAEPIAQLALDIVAQQKAHTAVIDAMLQLVKS